MSTFTDWNGPQGAQPRGLDLYQLTEAYSRVLTTLNEHITSKTAEGNVHNSKDYVDSKIAELRALVDGFNRFLTRADADESYATKQMVNNVNESAQNALTTAIDNLAIDNYLKKNDLTSHEVIELMREDIDRLAQELEHVNDWKNGEWACPNLKANGYVEGMLKAVEQVQFTSKAVQAQVGGTNLIGVYYVVGQLSGDSGDAFIKFISEDAGFSAKVSFVKNALTVVTSNTLLKDLCFLIVENDGNRYLAIQAVEWLSHFASSDGYGLFDKLDFEVAGVNFIPAGSNDYTRPNGACHVICECLSAGNGLAFSKLATPILRVQLFREENNPYLTLKDIQALDRVGLISQWPEWDTEGVAINVPEGYHACDGTDVLPEDDVDDEFRDKYQKYPLFDYSVIKTKSSIKVVGFDPTPVSNLVDAVCALHGIKFYYGLDALPVSYTENEPVVVQIDDKFAVYKYTAANGWTKYVTHYTDFASIVHEVEQAVTSMQETVTTAQETAAAAQETATAAQETATAAQETIENNTVEIVKAVCRLHGIMFYDGIDQRPNTYTENVPVIVKQDDKLFVYKYTEADGWALYTTEFGQNSGSTVQPVDLSSVNASIDILTDLMSNIYGGYIPISVYQTAADLPEQGVEKQAAYVLNADTQNMQLKYFRNGVWNDVILNEDDYPANPSVGDQVYGGNFSSADYPMPVYVIRYNGTEWEPTQDD